MAEQWMCTSIAKHSCRAPTAVLSIVPETSKSPSQSHYHTRTVQINNDRPIWQPDAVFDDSVPYCPRGIYIAYKAMYRCERCCSRVTARNILVASVVAIEMLLSMTNMMLTAAVSLSNVIDPCHPPVPCTGYTNMSDPHGDCSVYYACQVSAQLWQRMRCRLQDNETTNYDLNTGRCRVSSSQPTCHDRCPGK